MVETNKKLNFFRGQTRFMMLDRAQDMAIYFFAHRMCVCFCRMNGVGIFNISLDGFPINNINL